MQYMRSDVYQSVRGLTVTQNVEDRLDEVCWTLSATSYSAFYSVGWVTGSAYSSCKKSRTSSLPKIWEPTGDPDNLE